MNPFNKKNLDLPSEGDDLEKKLEKAERWISELEGMLTFKKSASEFSHEIGNILNFAITHISVLKRNIEAISNLIAHYQELKDHKINIQSKLKDIQSLEEEIDIELTKREVLDAVSVTETAFKRIQEVTYNMAHSNALQPIQFDVNKCIMNTLNMIEGNLEDNIKIKTSLASIPPIKSYRGKLNQVLTNLVKNAIEAIHEKHELQEEIISIETFQKEDTIVIKVEDTGIGMNQEIKDRLFNKFYSTKDQISGRGLGLGISKTIIEEHHGTIEVNSEVNNGSTFIITLPITH